jgi:hypothetical protein
MANPTPKKGTTWLRRILRWGIRLTILGVLLFYSGFYFFQEVKLLESHKTPTGYVSKPDIIPSIEGVVDPLWRVMPDGAESPKVDLWKNGLLDNVRIRKCDIEFEMRMFFPR